MKSKTNIFQNQKGVSLVEMLVVIMIITILSTIALMQFGSSKDQFRRQNVAQELKTAFERARFDSVKRRAEIVSGVDNRAKVTVNTTSFTLAVDKNGNGTIEQPADDSVNNFGTQNVTITNTAGNAMTFPVTVFYDKRGEVTATDNGGNTVNPIFIVCNGVCISATANSSNSNIVLVTPTGTVNLLGGGSAIPVFPTPAVTPVPFGSGIRNDVTLP
ncbi:MAG: pilus assembly FimT family protein [Aridibacter sp.]